MKMALIASLVIEALTAVELGSLLYWARLHHESNVGPGSWRQLLAASPARREPLLNGSPPRPGAAWTGRLAFLTGVKRLIREIFLVYRLSNLLKNRSQPEHPIN